MDDWLVVLYQPQSDGRDRAIPFGTWHTPGEAKHWAENDLRYDPSLGEYYRINYVRPVNNVH